jgi:hypothetical protein
MQVEFAHRRCRLTSAPGSHWKFLLSKTNGFVDSAHQRFCFERMGYEEGDVIAAFDGTNVDEKSLRRNIYWTNLTNEDLPYGRFHYSSFHQQAETLQIESHTKRHRAGRAP